MYLELLDSPIWERRDEREPIPLPAITTELHPTEEERVHMRARARIHGDGCTKSLEDSRSVADILSAPVPKDADGRTVTDVCLLGLLKRSPDDAMELLEKLPDERWCHQCRSAASGVLLHVGGRAAARLLEFHRGSEPLELLRHASTPLVFSQLLRVAFAGVRADYLVDARRYLRRFPSGTAKLALAVAAGVAHMAGDRSRAGMLLSVLARLGREREVRDAARELGLEAVADEWISVPPMTFGRDPKVSPPSRIVLEEKRLDAKQRQKLMVLLGRIDWALAGRDIPKLREALDPKSRARIAGAFAKRWKRRTSETWPALAAIALEPERAAEIASVKSIARSSRSYFQRNVERTAVDVIAGVAIAIPEKRDLALARLGSIALDPIKKRIHMAREAEKALVDVAEALDLPAETLDDRTIPTLGLDANASMTLDWGGRPVDVRMTPALELVFVVDGEKRAGQPAARKGDKKRLVIQAKKIARGLRTEARVLALGLGPRITRWMRDQQRWQMEDFEKNVLGHPILRAIARGFVWGTFDDAPFGGNLTATFRVAEDGSLADENDSVAHPRGRVGLLHVAELAPDLTRRWGTVMADYELLPIVPQLADLRVLTPAQATSQAITISEARYVYNPPPGWTRARYAGNYNVWERVIGRWRAAASYDHASKVLSSRVRAADDYEERWVNWGEVPAIVAHETLVDMQEMSGKT